MSMSFGGPRVLAVLLTGGLVLCGGGLARANDAPSPTAIAPPSATVVSPSPSPSEPQASARAAPEPLGMPYVYTKWEQFTTKEGLPNDHIFAVKADTDRVWIGTEDGLACLDKKTRRIQTWGEKDGLPWRVITGLEVDKRTGDVWIALFGGGLARFSGGRFDHWHQLNSGLVNNVVYAVCIEHDNVWASTTAGASRYNTKTGEWTIFTEKNAPMEEIWNYGNCCTQDKVFLAVWGGGVLEWNIAQEAWKVYLDPDGEMEIDLYRDDGIIHVITTGASYVENVLWVSTYFGVCRYDGRHWRGYFDKDSGMPSNFVNNLAGRSANEAWFCSDKGLGVIVDYASNTWVTYTTDHRAGKGKAVVKRDTTVLAEIETPPNLPHDYVLCADLDGNDAWVGTSKGLAHAVGEGYYPGLRPKAGAATAGSE
ncbi:MAG: regulator [Planctomycetota bacterium]